MLFQIYGDNTMWQLLGWILVFAGLILMNELARRDFLFSDFTGGVDCVFCGNLCGSSHGGGLGTS